MIRALAADSTSTPTPLRHSITALSATTPQSWCAQRPNRRFRPSVYHGRPTAMARWNRPATTPWRVTRSVRSIASPAMTLRMFSWSHWPITAAPRRLMPPASFNWIVDAGDPACLERPGGDALTIDQRGALRPFNGDETLGAQCDRGAYELSDSARVDVVVDDAALGQVLSSPTGIWCGAGSDESCSALFGFKTEVTLTASAKFRFRRRVCRVAGCLCRPGQSLHRDRCR